MIITLILIALIATFIIVGCIFFSGNIPDKTDEDVERDIREIRKHANVR